MANQVQMIDDAKKQARENVIRELEAQQKEAIDLGETDKVLQIERDINKQRAAEPQPPTNQPPPLSPVAQDWFNNNSHWFGQDPSASNVMKVELDRLEARGVDEATAIKQAEAKVKKYYPAYFDDEPVPQRRPAAPVERGQRKSTGPKKAYRFTDLPEAQRPIARKMAKQTGIKESDYVKQMLGN